MELIPMVPLKRFWTQIRARLVVQWSWLLRIFTLSWWKGSATRFRERVMVALRWFEGRALQAAFRKILELGRAIGAMPVGRAILYLSVSGIAAVCLLAILIAILLYIPSTQVAVQTPPRNLIYLEQGWGPTASSKDRQLYYYTPQGTSVLGVGLRYSWLVNLKRIDGQRSFVDPDHMRALGFLVDPAPTPHNPDQLPVGFARRYDPDLREDVVDLTCAVCHTGALHVQKNGESYAIRIDGGQAMHAVTSERIGQFGPTLVAAMGATLLNPLRFNRFAHDVLGDDYVSGRFALWWQVAKAWGAFLSTSFYAQWHDLYPVEEGFGRTDAVARISNHVFGQELDAAGNYFRGNAPVSYPALWDAPRFDWVQYLGSVSQPMARNLGESLGVGARLALTDDYGRPLPPAQQFRSTSLLHNLHEIENTLAKLQPPGWPEAILGSIDPAKRDRGKALFQTRCAHCHQPCRLTPEDMRVQRPLRDLDDPLWRVTMVDAQRVGTDPQAALNFYNVRLDLTKAGIDRNLLIAEERTILEERMKRTVAAYRLSSSKVLECEIEQALDSINLQSASIGAALHYMAVMLTKRMYRDMGLSEAEQQEFNGQGALDTPQVVLQYKARPLAGAWATGPYLHNGSVPTLYEMLIPASDRTKRFFLTSQMQFDPVRVGVVTAPTSTKGFWFDTSIPGNGNIGHEFRAGYAGTPQNGVIGPELTEQERWDILEYLKTHRDDPPVCPASPPPPPSVGCQ